MEDGTVLYSTHIRVTPVPPNRGDGVIPDRRRERGDRDKVGVVGAAPTTTPVTMASRPGRLPPGRSHQGRGPPPLGRGSTPHAAGNHPPAESRLPMRPLFLLRPLAASVLDANVRKLRKKGENGLGSFLGF